MFLSVLIFFACAKPKSPVSHPDNGKIGVYFKRVDNWMLVTDVVEGMSADTAGLKPGDRLLEVNGEPIFDGDHNRLIGPTYTQITLTVHSPFAANSRTVDLIRGLASNGPRISPTQLKVQSFITAASADRMQWFDDSANAFETHQSKLSFWSMLVQHSTLETWSEGELQALARHVPSLAELDALQYRFPEFNLVHHLQDTTMVVNLDEEGQPSHHNGWPYLEWRTQKNLGEKAIQTSEGLPVDVTENMRQASLDYHWDGALMADIGMAPYESEIEWTVPLPSPSLPEIRLLNEEPWQWDSQSFTVVNLWATWCGPCRKEMPEFVELSQKYQDQNVRFIAVSTDRLRDRDKVDAMVSDWKLPFAVAHEPRLNQAFQVTGIPAIRVLNSNGQLVYQRKGYSPTAMDELSVALESQLKDPKPLQFPLAYSLMDTDFVLDGFISIPDLRSMSLSGNNVWVSRNQHLPILLDEFSDQFESVPSKHHHPNKIIVHGSTLNEGPMVADRGGYLIRAYNNKAQTQWFQSTQSPILELQLVDNLLYVHTNDSILVLDHNGELVHRFEGHWLDIEKTDGGVWALSDGHLYRLNRNQMQQLQARPEAATLIQADGQLTNTLYSQMTLGSSTSTKHTFLYRPKHGQLPAAVLHEDSSKVHQTIFLSGLDHQIGLWDSRNDGEPELLISFPNVGLALFRLHTAQ
ncbi:MAG: redoxin family protein [Myxococcota bacterium]|nr:redoxin family protein [Myxococcota bacterium]